jgi:predicted nucleic acid-binding protein
MIDSVVSDTGPLNYLVLIDCADLLGHLFRRLYVPTAVRSELIHESAPAKVSGWIGAQKPWLIIQSVKGAPKISGLHRGETEALGLATALRVKTILIDDLDGRSAARRLGLIPVGTVGVLEPAAELGLADLAVAISRLKQTSFFISDAVLDAALRRDQARRRKKEG